MSSSSGRRKHGIGPLIAGARAAALIAAALACVLLLAACGGSDEQPTPTATASPRPATATPRAATATPAPATAVPMTTAPPPPSPAPGTYAYPARVPSVPGTSVTISAVGDVSLARQVVQRMEANGAVYPYALIQPLLDGDIVIGNLEGALTERGEPWPKGYNFRTPPRFAPGLAQAGFDLVSLANNHAMDYGIVGLEDTAVALTQAGVRAAGAGVGTQQPPDAAAYAPMILEANGLRVAFVACALTPTEGGGFAITAWAALPDRPGIAICSTDGIAQQVQAARAAADFVVVYPHAGDEYVNTPSATQRQIAASAFAAGADAYIGHHAHVVQPVELRDGKLTAWGLGNFIFDLDEVDLANIPQPRVSLVLRFTLTKGAGVTAFEALPVVLDDAEDRPRLATPGEAAILHDLITP